MKALRALLIPAIAAAGLAVASIDAQAQHHFSGGGHFAGGHHFSGGHFRGGCCRFGVFVGAPLFWWGWPGYYDPYYYYGPPPVVYRDVVPAYPDGQMAPAPQTEMAVPGPGAPSQGPLYMNYCESARAYYPKVASCPEGWKFVPQQR